MLYILYSHKGVKCEFIGQSGRDGGLSIAALLLQKYRYMDAMLLLFSAVSEVDHLIEAVIAWM